MQTTGFDVGLGVIAPFFAIMISGYVAGRLHILPDGSSDVLSRFVFVVALPALIFVSIARIPVADFFNWPFLATLGGGMLIMFVIGLVVAHRVFPDNLTANALHGLTVMYSSTAYIGLPLLLIIFGNDALVPGIIGAVITGTVFAPLAIVLIELDQGRVAERRLWSRLIRALGRPPIVATVAGLLVSGSGLELAAPVVNFCEVLGGAFVPCALFAAGLFIAGCKMQGIASETGWLVFAKLLLHPLITWWLAYHVFELQGILPAIAVIQSALPSGVPVFVLAQQYNTFVARSSATIAWSTALSIITLSVLIVFLKV